MQPHHPRQSSRNANLGSNTAANYRPPGPYTMTPQAAQAQTPAGNPSTSAMTAVPSAPRSGRQVAQAAEGSAPRAGSSLWRPGTMALAPDDFTLVEHTRADGILVLMGNLGHAGDAVSWRNWLAESDIAALHDVHRYCLRIQYVSPQCVKLYLARPLRCPSAESLPHRRHLQQAEARPTPAP